MKNPPPHIRNKKKLIFKAVAILLPFIGLSLTEGGLRVFRYGHNLDLFVEDKGNTDYLVMNQYASKRYFTEQENATMGTFEPFRKEKLPGSLRIFVLGESTTLGYPYMYNASFHRWLHYRLMNTFPGKEFEIINLSLTAVNSWTVLGFAKELVDYEPDAVLMYCGQNEYYGTLGVGSSSRLGTSRLVVQSLLHLRSLRLVQLTGNTLQRIRSFLKGKPAEPRGTLMKRMAARQEIPFGSSAYHHGIRQFGKNMEAICMILSKRNVPLFISNLVSNEKDLKPFTSAEGDTAGSALHHFLKAEAAYRKGNFTSAKKQYVRAKDLDLLRFRAPEALNQIIAGLPERFPSVHLVDAKKLFEAHSPHGIIGRETILEHVHPNLFGYGLLSEAFYQALKQHQVIAPKEEFEISLLQLRKEMPITRVDSLKGTYEIMILRENWPFNERKTFDPGKLKSYEEKLAMALLGGQISWNDAIQHQMNYFLTKNDQRNAAKVAEAAALQYPNDVTFLRYAGKFCLNLQQPDKAAMYFQKALFLDKHDKTTVGMLNQAKASLANPYHSFK